MPRKIARTQNQVNPTKILSSSLLRLPSCCPKTGFESVLLKTEARNLAACRGRNGNLQAYAQNVLPHNVENRSLSAEFHGFPFFPHENVDFVSPPVMHSVGKLINAKALQSDLVAKFQAVAFFQVSRKSDDAFAYPGIRRGYERSAVALVDPWTISGNSHEVAIFGHSWRKESQGKHYR